MNESQLQDLGIVNEQLGLMQQETDLLKTTLLACETQARKLEKELVLSKNIIKWTGVGCMVIGCALLITSSFIEEKIQKNVIMTLGGITAGAGLVGFVWVCKF